ncbi:MAG TPA: hypothetical protein VIE16_04955 [Phenylobacterium sp.]
MGVVVVELVVLLVVPGGVSAGGVVVVVVVVLLSAEGVVVVELSVAGAVESVAVVEVVVSAAFLLQPARPRLAAARAALMVMSAVRGNPVGIWQVSVDGWRAVRRSAQTCNPVGLGLFPKM